MHSALRCFVLCGAPLCCFCAVFVLLLLLLLSRVRYSEAEAGVADAA
jgi:hypothetical protein